MDEYAIIINKLHASADKKHKASMSRFGIDTGNALGIPVPKIRILAKEIGKNHKLAEQLFKSGIHEAKILASMVDDANDVTERQMDKWVAEINSWDICDSLCGNLFVYTKYAKKKCVEWSSNDAEYIKRAGFALMAYLAVHNKTMDDGEFISFFKYIENGSIDERNFVKKSVNWALRQIGKRNKTLNGAAITAAITIREINKNSKSARWIAADALRELESKRFE